MSPSAPLLHTHIPHVIHFPKSSQSYDSRNFPTSVNFLSIDYLVPEIGYSVTAFKSCSNVDTDDAFDG